MKYDEYPLKKQEELSEFLFENWKVKVTQALALQSVVHKFLLVASGTGIFIITSNIEIIRELTPVVSLKGILICFLASMCCAATALYLFATVSFRGVGETSKQMLDFKFNGSDYDTLQGWDFTKFGNLLYTALNLASIALFIWASYKSINLLA